MLNELTGCKFGRLTVLYRDFNNPKSSKRTYWMCRCDCGNEVSVAAQSLLRKTNNTESCGCIRKENNKRIKEVTEKVDIIGKRFGRLTVIKESDQKSGKRHKTMYECICDCGNTHTLVGEALKNGSTKSCGCIYKETRSEIFKKYNTYDLTTYNFGVGYADNGTHFFFDKEDYFKIKNYSWWYDGRYVIAHSLPDDKYTTEIIRMHRVVMDIEDRENINVDHKNLVRYDCRKMNLRKATDIENARNSERTYCTIDNPIGVKKVNENRFDVYISGKYSGSRNNFDEAVSLRQFLEKEIFGEFRYNPEQQKLMEINFESEIDSLLLCLNS